MYLSEDKFCKPQPQRDLHFNIFVKSEIFNALRVKYFYFTMELVQTKM